MYVFGLDAATVARRLNGVDRFMANNNARLSTTDLEDLIDEGAGLVAATLATIGASAELINADDTSGAYHKCRACIVAYVRWQALEQLGQDTAAQRAQDAYQRAIKALSERPAELGEAAPSQDASMSNLALDAAGQATRRDDITPAKRFAGDYGGMW